MNKTTPYHSKKVPHRFLFSDVYPREYGGGDLPNSVYVDDSEKTIWAVFGHNKDTEEGIGEYTENSRYIKWIKDVYGNPFAPAIPNEMLI